MQKELGLAGRCGFALLGVAVVALPIAYLSKAIDFGAFSAVAVFWLLVSAVLIFGDSITEITLWKASIKRDATATRAAREEVEAIRDQLRKVSSVSVENTYLITGQLSSIMRSLAGEANYKAFTTTPESLRLIKNMNDIWKFVEPDDHKGEEARKRFLRELGRQVE